MPMKLPTKIRPFLPFSTFNLHNHTCYLQPQSLFYRKYACLSLSITSLPPSQLSQKSESKLLCSAVKISFLALYSLFDFDSKPNPYLFSCEILEFPHAYSYL
ncbi:hypothetical protein Csa_014710 [Cucumis sativus]|uniref:Uncharacterized protein n=1 Tax=Cucumis sativus TaxID=3659 RepID=A0A0A0KYZ7_CUCSA|nr:hypothetical protein Csa_014710 [Cucumis sativus]